MRLMPARLSKPYISTTSVVWLPELAPARHNLCIWSAPPCHSAAGELLNELHQLLLCSLRWTDLTDSVLVQGGAPSAREMPGVTSDGSLVFIFGGGGIRGA